MSIRIVTRAAVVVAATAVAAAGLVVPARAAAAVTLPGSAGAGWFGADGPTGAVSHSPEAPITAQVDGDEVRLALWDAATPAHIYLTVVLARTTTAGVAPVLRMVTGDGSVCDNSFNTVVRDAQHDPDGVPQVLDLSVTASCDGVRTVELRIGTPAQFALVLAGSAAISTLPGTDATKQLDVTNVGGSPATLGTPVASDATGRLSFAGCDGVVLGPGGSCSLAVTYHGLPDPGGARTWVIHVPVTVGGLAYPDALGFVSTLTALLPRVGRADLAYFDGTEYLTWAPPSYDNGFPVTSWRIRKLVDDVPVDVAELPVDRRYLPVPGAQPGDLYQVSAVTDRGEGPPAQNSRTMLVPSQVDIGVGELDQDRGLVPGVWISSPEGLRLPLSVDGHEYTSPAVDARGNILVVSRAGTGGPGGTDWDLWESGIHVEAQRLQLTALPGQETGAELSPDGTTVAFTYRPAPTAVPEVWTVAIIPDLGPPTMPTPVRRFVGASHPSWRSGSELVVADERTSGAPLLRLRLTLASATVLGSYPGTAGGREPTVAWDARSVAFVTGAGLPMRLELPAGTVVAEQVQPAAPAGVRFGDPTFAVDGNVVWTQALAGDPLPVRFSWRREAGQSYVQLFPAPRVSSTPTVSVPATPRVVRPGVTYPVLVDDPMLRSVVTTCRVDGGPALDCSAGIPTAGLSSAVHRVTVTATGLWDTASVAGTFRVDGVAPTAAKVVGPSRVRTERVQVRSAATDDDRVESYDGRERLSYFGSRPSARHAIALNGLPGQTELLVEPGQSRCLSVRARDAAGNVGPWGPERCVTRMADEHNLEHGKAWRLRKVAGAAEGTALRTSRPGARLVATRSVDARRIVLVAQQCRRCGTLEVRVGSRLIGRVDLRGPSKLWREVTLRTRSAPEGRLTLTSTTHRRVALDGYYAIP